MKGILIKRLQSSFYAFRQKHPPLHRDPMIVLSPCMYDGGTVYISKDVDVYDLLDNDDLDALEQYVEKKRKPQKYSSEDFRPGDFITDLQHDLELLCQTLKRGLEKKLTQDPKLRCLPPINWKKIAP